MQKHVHPALLFLLLMTACGDKDSSPPTSPGDTTPIATPVLVSLSGTVVEWTPQGERPLSGVPVWGFFPNLRSDPLPYVRTDEFGRYELPAGSLTPGTRLQVIAGTRGYFLQCAQQITVGETTHLNIPLIAEANLSPSRDSVPPSRPGFRIVTGVAFTTTTQGRLPSAHRDVEAGDSGHVTAYTKTDDHGRFLVCGLPQSRDVWIAADVGNTWAQAFLPPGGDADIELQ